MLTLMQPGGPPDAAAAGIFAVFGGLWCCIASSGIAQDVMAIIAIIQILSRQPMAGADKLLWAIVSWVIPVLGPILWWVIGSKQYPPQPPPGGPPAGPGQY